MAAILTHKFGRSFPTAMVAGGYALIGFGAFVLLGNIIVGLFLILIGGFAAFSTNGIMLNPSKKMYKQYGRCFGITSGKWESYHNYPYLTVLRRNMKTVAHSRSMVSTSEVVDVYHDIFLLNKTHRSKLLIWRSTKKENAQEIAKDLGEILGVEYTAYKPVLSAKTRSRRR